MYSSKTAPILVVGLCACVLLWSCASQPDLSDLNPAQRSKLAAMPVFKSEGLPPGSYETIGKVQSICCKESFRPADETMKMKITAAQLGADAILNLTFQDNDEKDWVRDCWATVIGTGDAVRITDSGAARK